jgi:hypothetical protein
MNEPIKNTRGKIKLNTNGVYLQILIVIINIIKMILISGESSYVEIRDY